MGGADESDVVVLGGGPAGATAGRLLAKWGHRVTLLTRIPDARRALAECLPPSTRKLFSYLGIQDAIDSAGFYRTTGNTVWWGDGAPRVELYPAGCGYQAPRPALDDRLLTLAKDAGVSVRIGQAQVCDGSRIFFHGNEQKSRFVLDCTGRAGLLARCWREKRPGARSVALCAIWRDDTAWNLPDPSHTLVESYDGAWAWSVPTQPGIRYVAFMTDGRHTYEDELSRTGAFRKVFSRGSRISPVWGRDAAVYSSTHYAGPGFLLVGDAGATLDPLSSFGVKKAVASGWVAAVVANTCLSRPDMAATAIEFFEKREREVFESYDRLSAAWHGDETVPDGVTAALAKLRSQPSIALRIAPGIDRGRCAGIEGREIVLHDAIGGIDSVANLSAVRLAEMAPHFQQVPELFDAYSRTVAPVTLPDFLMALATLLSRGVLI